MKRHKPRFEDIRVWWINYQILVLDGFTRIPLLSYPSATTETRAINGALGGGSVKPKVPSYRKRPDKQVLLFMRAFRTLKTKEQISYYCKHVLEATNTATAEVHNCAESAVRYRLASADSKLKKYVNKYKI